LSTGKTTGVTWIRFRYPDFVLGRIVLIDEHVASESSNPYFLRLGTVFYVLTVTSLNLNEN
jgi:hypothetical protein